MTEQLRGQTTCAVVALWSEYVGESEHQDGTDYWNKFGSVDEVLKDYALYLTNRDWDEVRDQYIPTLEGLKGCLVDFDLRDREYMV